MNSELETFHAQRTETSSFFLAGMAVPADPGGELRGHRAGRDIAMRGHERHTPVAANGKARVKRNPREHRHAERRCLGFACCRKQRLRGTAMRTQVCSTACVHDQASHVLRSARSPSVGTTAETTCLSAYAHAPTSSCAGIWARSLRDTYIPILHGLNFATLS